MSNSVRDPVLRQKTTTELKAGIDAMTRMAAEFRNLVWRPGVENMTAEDSAYLAQQWCTAGAALSTEMFRVAELLALRTRVSFQQSDSHDKRGDILHEEGP